MAEPGLEAPHALNPQASFEASLSRWKNMRNQRQLSAEHKVRRLRVGDAKPKSAPHRVGARPFNAGGAGGAAPSVQQANSFKSQSKNPQKLNKQNGQAKNEAKRPESAEEEAFQKKVKAKPKSSLAELLKTPPAEVLREYLKMPQLGSAIGAWLLKHSFTLTPIVGDKRAPLRSSRVLVPTGETRGADMAFQLSPNFEEELVKLSKELELEAGREASKIRALVAAAAPAVALAAATAAAAKTSATPQAFKPVVARPNDEGGRQHKEFREAPIKPVRIGKLKAPPAEALREYLKMPQLGSAIGAWLLKHSFTLTPIVGDKRAPLRSSRVLVPTGETRGADMAFQLSPNFEEELVKLSKELELEAGLVRIASSKARPLAATAAPVAARGPPPSAYRVPAAAAATAAAPRMVVDASIARPINEGGHHFGEIKQFPESRMPEWFGRQCSKCLVIQHVGKNWGTYGKPGYSVVEECIFS